MSEAFDILSGALDKAIANAKSEKKFLKSNTLEVEFEPLQDYTAAVEISHS